MKALNEQAAAAKEVDKEKKQRRRRQNRRPTKPSLDMLPGCSSVDAACGPEKWSGIIGSAPNVASEIAFNSLPTMHFNGNGGVLGLDIASEDADRGEISKSCPFPGFSFPVEEVPPGGAARSGNSKKYFDPHWSDMAVEEAIKKGRAFKATFRVNAHNRLEAYCTIDGLPVDVLINGIPAQNRAIEGDIVAIVLDPVANWVKLKGASVRSSLIPSDGVDNITEAREVIDYNDVHKEIVDLCCKSSIPSTNSLPSDNGYHNHESSGLFETVISDFENGSTLCDKLCKRLNVKTLTNSVKNWESEHREAARALERICAMISSNQSKRPTGRVLSIIRNSPRREAVIGFLALKPWVPEGVENRRQSNDQPPKKSKEPVLLAGLDYIQLIPTDSKFPKMVVNVESLPDCAKERLNNGDLSIERELIAARVDNWNEESLCPKAQVIHMLGQGGETEAQMSAILFKHRINSFDFSAESLACLPDLPWKVPEEELKIRKDLRNMCTFTIDPPSAMELDDAFSVEQLSDKTFRIGVHIADVSYFVLPDTALNTEAQVRSTSVYIPQRKLSMLPLKLSQVCSLLPGLDRLAFSIIWEIDDSGNIMQHWIGRSVIRSCCKLSYDNVDDLMHIGFGIDRLIHFEKLFPELHGHFEQKDIVDSLRILHVISMKLRESRFRGGAIELENPKLAILFDENGSPSDSFLDKRKESGSLVEEFMLLANKSVAEVISRVLPDSALLRRHPEPNLRKLKEFEVFCEKHGFDLDASTSGKLYLSLSKIKEKLRNDPVLFDIVLSYASKAMQTASYVCSRDFKGKEDEWAHYGLSFPHFTHFTSPLRRYPDIVVHRTLSAILEAESIYVKLIQTSVTANNEQIPEQQIDYGFFTGLHFDKNAAESEQGGKALSLAVLKHKVPGSEMLAEVASYCNERQLACKHAEGAGVELYLWTLLKKREVIFSSARVLALGPRFMTIYISNYAIEKRIYYDEVEGLVVEWLEATNTLVLNLPKTKPFQRRGIPGKSRAMEDVALVLNTSELVLLEDNEHPTSGSATSSASSTENNTIFPSCFPLVLQTFSTIPVALYAVGGHDGPIDVVPRIYMCSYLK
ncbi:DIS3-like exonuclease 2 isoform X2 [Curcuma longa]|uniref:DIS3-like exonuclease 2 isoform X2 n=1 Tax=Curcuma longa TaxID=136217 RepID=UPI003D9E7785